MRRVRTLERLVKRFQVEEPVAQEPEGPGAKTTEQDENQPPARPVHG